MVSLREIKQANESTSGTSRTALFVGGTSGIGLGAIEALAKNTKGSNIYIVGRSETKFAETLKRLQSIDPKASITFIEAQVSLLKEVQRVCTFVTQHTTSLDLLWLSQGGLGLREREALTSEGLPVDFAVSYYGRILFMHKLAPLLSKSSDGRVISVLCAGMEGPVNIEDPGLRQEKSYAAAGFWGAQKQAITMQSLAMRQLASQYSSVSFIHTNPGMVSTDVHDKWTGMFTGVWTPLAWLMKLVLIPLMHMIGFTPEQAGETGIYVAMSRRFGSAAGRNFFRLDEHAEEYQKNGRATLEKYQTDGIDRKIWEHTLGVFEEVLST